MKISAFGTTSGILGGIGSIHNVCHSLCVTIVSILAIFGITTSILPLMFLQTYRMYFWMGALVFTTTSFYFYLKQKHKVIRDRNLLIINTGLLIFGLPFPQLADYMDFFRFLGGSLVISGILLFLFGKRFQSLFLDQKNIQYAKIATDTPILSPASTVQLPKLNLSSLLFALVIGGFLVNQYLMYKMNIMEGTTFPSNQVVKNSSGMTAMKLTAFDIALAKERMDKNNDGICDVCGMPIDQCVSSGQIDCNMGNNPQAIGILGSQHIHADFKMYINGQAFDFAKPEYFMKSSFLHVDNNQNKDDASSVLHMHAKKVPTWIFFRSIGMNLTKDSLTLADGRMLKNENGKTLKFYLNGKKVDELEDYSFQPLDKLLISYGPENDVELDQQINSVTNFAKDHQK